VNKIRFCYRKRQRLDVPNSISCSMTAKYLTLGAALNHDEARR